MTKQQKKGRLTYEVNLPRDINLGIQRYCEGSTGKEHHGFTTTTSQRNAVRNVTLRNFGEHGPLIFRLLDDLSGGNIEQYAVVRNKDDLVYGEVLGKDPRYKTGQSITPEDKELVAEYFGK